MATSDNDRRPFPEDLAMEILPRLPVESLLRFKCVSKKWYEVIKSPDFMRKHLNWSSKKKIPKILIYDHAGCPEIDAHIPPNPNPITLISVSDAPAVVLVPDYLQEFRGMTFLLGSIDGLFLLERKIYGSIFLALWNPATRETRSLLSPNFEHQEKISNGFGFGLDTMTNDYKVVWFQSPYFNSQEPIRSQPTVSVYSCSRDSWSILQPENSEILRHRRVALGTAYLNGAYYMLALRTTHFSILSFDFGSEVVAEIRLPDDPRPFYGWELELTLLDDSIAIFTNIEKFYYTMWVMIQPGVWKKLLTFQCFGSIQSWNPYTILFATSRDRLVSYDVRTQETRYLGFRHPRLRDGNRLGGCSSHYYKESLVTIKRNLVP